MSSIYNKERYRYAADPERLHKAHHGPDIPGGCLLADGGRIAAIAPHIDPPEGCTVIDAGGRLLTPGCVEAHCHIGLDNECLRWEGMDYNEWWSP